MAKDTWNFSSWQLNDSGPSFDRGRAGQVLTTGPGAFGGALSQPFTESFTYIFSFYARTGWSADDSLRQNILSWGIKGTFTGIGVALFLDTTGTPHILVTGDDLANGIRRYHVELGDEDGVSWLGFDKWYQVGLHISNTTISYAVNGSNSPKVTVTTNSPGDLNMDAGSEILTLYGGTSNFGTSGGDWGARLEGYPSVIAGPFALSTQVLDFSSSTVRDRIWDANGDFINAGENGSGWFGAYDANIPEQYSHDGSIRAIKENTMVWRQFNGGSPGNNNFPGGLRKQLEA